MRLLSSAALLLASVATAHARAEPRTLIGEAWHGIDGNWSTTELWVGNVDVTKATMNLIISTSLSETWVVSSGGCADREQLCTRERGGTLDTRSSSSWHSLGDWQLSFPYGSIQANGNYGLDTLVIRDSQTKTLVALDKALIGSYTSTEYYNGFFGLGIVSGEFGKQILDSPFSQMVATYGWFPSYTYGYTAGAYYKNSGTPSSLVLGGYDENRFIPHNVEFTLTRDTAQPKALVRGIEVSAPKGNTPGNWDSDVRILSRMNQSFEAIIDSSTPYLWLPEAVCDEFIEAFNLTRNDTLGAYVMLNDQAAALKEDDSFSFTFSLSSYDNNDDFGHPLGVPGCINITISAHAFAQTLRYPYNNMAIQYMEAAKPYFPIKRASGNNFILGRTFLQEAYLLTKYDSTVFSVHQALFPEDRLDTSIVEVKQPSNSVYPPPADTGGRGGLSRNQMIGIVAGAVVGSLMAFFVFFFCCRRRRKRVRMGKVFSDEDAKETASSIMPETPKTPVARIFSRIVRRKRSKKAGSTADASGTEGGAVEVGADAAHAVYEMPAPLGPVELDADTYSIMSETELGTGGEEEISAYEAARRKMERRMQGPVPAYSPPSDLAMAPTRDGSNGLKSMQDVSLVQTYQPADQVSPTSSSPTYANTDSLPHTLPSPSSPVTADWNTRSSDLPSPMTVSISIPSPTYPSNNHNCTLPPRSASSRSQASVSRSGSSNAPSPTHSGPFQRTPIDPSRIICLGPLPENVQLPILGPRRPSAPQPPSRHGPASPGLMENPGASASTDTLGSNFTDMEEEQMALHADGSDGDAPRGGEISRSTSLPGGAGGLASPQSLERIDGGTELIHVPQLAERRYSWEEER